MLRFSGTVSTNGGRYRLRKLSARSESNLGREFGKSLEVVKDEINVALDELSILGKGFEIIAQNEQSYATHYFSLFYQ